MKRALQILKRILNLSGYLLISPLLVLVPRNPHKIVFGAWSGKQFSCNPKYLFKYLAPRGKFTCIWVGGESLREEVMKVSGAHFARIGSLAALWHCLTAKFYVYNICHREDVSNFPHCHRAVLVYVTHGYADKYDGIKQFSGNGLLPQEKKSFQRLRDVLNRIEDWLRGPEAWSSESSEQSIDIMVSNLPYAVSRDRMLRFGKPRADYFIHNKDNDEERKTQKEKIAKILGLPSDKKWYIFVPTWRHDLAKIYSFTTMKQKLAFVKLLEDQNAIVIEKQHPIVLQRCRLPFGFKDNIAVVTPEQSRLIDTQELLMASDRMITDYSSIYYDFVLMNRPVIHFAPDFDDFMNREMGFNFDIRQYGGGPFAYSEDELLVQMSMTDEELLSRRNPSTLRDHLTYEKGTACENYEKFFEEMGHVFGNLKKSTHL